MAPAFLAGTPPGGCGYTEAVCLAPPAARSSAQHHREKEKGAHCLAKRLLLLALQLQRLLRDALAREVAICSPNSHSTGALASLR